MKSRFTRHLTAVSIGLAGILALSACGGGSEAADTSTSQTGGSGDAGTSTTGSDATNSTDGGSGEAPVHGGELRYGVNQDPVCVDPHQANSHPGLTVSRGITDSLLEQDPDTGDYAGWLAESWEVNDDATEFTFTLRDDVTFSDGTPLTPEVVIGNIEAIISNDTASALAKTPFINYDSSTVVDEHTLTITFSKPNSPFLQVAADIRFGIIGQASLDATPEERCQSVIGTGAFVLESFEPQVQATMVRREGYAWASSLRENQGEAYLDKVIVQVVPDDSVRIGMLQSDQIDLTNGVPVQSETELADGGFELYSRPAPGLANALWPNLAVSQLQDPAVREALSLGVDRQEIWETVLSDIRPMAGNILSTPTLGYVDRTDLFPFDQARAIELLDAAGWAPGADGIREKDGKKLSFSVIYIGSVSDAALGLQLVQQQLAAIGVEITLRPLDLTDWYAERAAGSADLMWQNATRADADILYNFHSADAANYSKIDNPDLDALLDAQRATGDVDERVKIVADAQALILENHYAIPLDQQYQVHGNSTKVKDLAYEVSSRLSFYETWLAAS